MPSPTAIGIISIAIALSLALLIGARVELTRARGGKILAFVTLFVIPAVITLWGFSEHMERAESTQFCLSCHVMHDFGQSLHVDDPSYIPARHYQNNLVPRDRACYTCHTDYTMFGPIHSKIRGLRHLYVQYLGTPPAPENIKLYTPFNNRECLYCHAGMRVFLEESKHTKQPGLLSKLTSNQVSCMTNGCHDIVHNVATLKDATFWSGGK